MGESILRPGPVTIPLETLARSAQQVLVVRPLDPPERHEAVSVLPPGSLYTGRNEPPFDEYGPFHPLDGGEPALDRNYPPFMCRWSRFEVLESVRGASTVAPGSEIEVRMAHFEIHRSGHESYYVYGVVEWSVLHAYRAAVPLAAGAPRLIFVRDARTVLEYCVDGAEESVERRAEVEALLRG